MTVFLPLLGALSLYRLPERWWRGTALAASGLVLALAVLLAVRYAPGAGVQFEEHVPWIPSLGASYHLGVDGLSLPLVLLSPLLTFLVVLFTRRPQPNLRDHYLLFLVPETGVLGTFTTLDLLLFYLLWEVSLVPM